MFTANSSRCYRTEAGSNTTSRPFRTFAVCCLSLATLASCSTLTVPLPRKPAPTSDAQTIADLRNVAVSRRNEYYEQEAYLMRLSTIYTDGVYALAFSSVLAATFQAHKDTILGLAAAAGGLQSYSARFDTVAGAKAYAEAGNALSCMIDASRTIDHLLPQVGQLETQRSKVMAQYRSEARELAASRVRTADALNRAALEQARIKSEIESLERQRQQDGPRANARARGNNEVRPEVVRQDIERRQLRVRELNESSNALLGSIQTSISRELRVARVLSSPDHSSEASQALQAAPQTFRDYVERVQGRLLTNLQALIKGASFATVQADIARVVDEASQGTKKANEQRALDFQLRDDAGASVPDLAPALEFKPKLDKCLLEGQK